MNSEHSILHKPDYLFEVSWEVCNKVGGIHTVIATKAVSILKLLDNSKYITIGPDINMEGPNPEFEEDPELFKQWRARLNEEGIRIRIGRWRVKGNPIAMLVDFTPYIKSKDDILKFLWETYKVDSLHGEWDYIEPVLFGYAAGKVIDSFVDTFCTPTERPVAQFHEWMTGSGGLYLKQYCPQTATVFTTHATVMGRSIAGNGLPLYSGMETFNVDEYARAFRVTAKHSIEKASAENMDCFTTVSDITAKECEFLLGRVPDLVTPNGFEDDIVPPEPELRQKRENSRRLMINIAEACLGIEFEGDPLIIATSGRYEFRNKGLDIFLDALSDAAIRPNSGRDILAFVMVPAGNNGPRKDLLEHLSDAMIRMDATQDKHATHYITGHDPIIETINSGILSKTDTKVHVIYVPTYLNGNDGIFNLPYYDLLCGMDATVFASYYEPWGYTPLESVAFSVPTVTTSLAGFGLWVETHLKNHSGTEVIYRDDSNDREVTDKICNVLLGYTSLDQNTLDRLRADAYKVSRIALWSNLIKYYEEAFIHAIENGMERQYRPSTWSVSIEQTQKNTGISLTEKPVWTRVMVEKSLPERLHPLEILSRNLWWSWSESAPALFRSVDPALWKEIKHNPIALLDRLTTERTEELLRDDEFLNNMDSVYRAFNEYMSDKSTDKPFIGYFSMEFGIHSTLKIYSGGLGILAGDYLKESSDSRIPMVGVGLLYRYGYFNQKLSSTGEQEVAYESQNFHKLPITPARDNSGNWLSITIAFPGRSVTARIWKCEVGRTDLYLLDTDHDLNSPEDRTITHYLYGGDWENRFKQELLLGIGGIRALAALNIDPDVFHCNEGHAAFIGIERINQLIQNSGLNFDEALEVVRSSSLFTTHTPVPAGHDSFEEALLRQYISHYPDRLGITWDRLMNLGRMNPNTGEKFSMSFLAAHLSQEINGVSWLHGEVTKDIFKGLWPGYFKDELNIGYVTNGVHLPTWTSSYLRKLYNNYFPEGLSGTQHKESWQKVRDIPDNELWAIKNELKERLVSKVQEAISDPSQSLVTSPKQIVRVKECFKTDVLTIGFARRFATYKRGNLLFTDLDRLDKIVNDPERPVQFVFAGKAHPNDKPGQDLIKRIIEVAGMERFAGKVIFLENYDMALARKMIQGVDVWLNTPSRKQEASGTSGEKAVMNGVLQFSVLDGWWVEGYKKGAGWMLPIEATYTDERYQNELDAELIYATLEEQIIPLYYTRNPQNIPYKWISAMKVCIADIAPEFTTARMIGDYKEKFYDGLFSRNKEMVKDDYALAKSISEWKRHIQDVWDKLRVLEVKKFDMNTGAVFIDSTYPIEVVLDLAGLSPEDIGVELLIARQIDNPDDIKIRGRYQLKLDKLEGTIAKYVLEAEPGNTGSFDIACRIYPKNPSLRYRMDFPLVKWA